MNKLVYPTSLPVFHWCLLLDWWLIHLGTVHLVPSSSPTAQAATAEAKVKLTHMAFKNKSTLYYYYLEIL